MFANMKNHYLDSNATTPMEPEVLDVVTHYLTNDFGNAGSQSHERGAVAKRAVTTAREQVARVVDCDSTEVLFTSGATESNNLAILGLADWAKSEGRTHIVTTAIEHKAVLEPVNWLAEQGFDIDVVPVDATGLVRASDIEKVIRHETSLVSVIQVNNETGVKQMLDDIGYIMRKSFAMLHVDAAQGFGKCLDSLRNQRIDLISVSGHKIYGPKGVGALIARRRNFKRPPLKPLMLGGGQERGLRPGTLAVPLIAGLGKAAELALRDIEERTRLNRKNQEAAIKAFSQLGAQINGDPDHLIANTLNVSIPGLNSEAAMVALKGVAELSNGSACTSSSYEPSHVLTAMGLDEDRVAGALRFSWSHLTGEIEWPVIVDRLQSVI